MMHHHATPAGHHKKSEHAAGGSKSGQRGQRLKPSNSNPSLLAHGRRKSGCDGNPDEN